LTSVLSSSQFETTTSEDFVNRNQEEIQEETVDDQHSTPTKRIIDRETESYSGSKVRFRETNSNHQRALHLCHIIYRREVSTTSNNY
jgi:hypothetical protein